MLIDCRLASAALSEELSARMTGVATNGTSSVTKAIDPDETRLLKMPTVSIMGRLMVVPEALARVKSKEWLPTGIGEGKARVVVPEEAVALTVATGKLAGPSLPVTETMELLVDGQVTCTVALPLPSVKYCRLKTAVVVVPDAMVTVWEEGTVSCIPGSATVPL